MRFQLSDLNPALRKQAEEQLRRRNAVTVRTVKALDAPEKGNYSSNKYHARKVIEDGIKFDSKKEYRCYRILKARQEKGEIEGLRLQVKFSLFDAGGFCRGEHIGTYRADFVFQEHGKLVVADCKSEKTRTLRDWPRTKALMRACHGIEVREL